MIAALRGSYVDYVLFMGVTEKYPLWFELELDESIYTDESRYTFYVPIEERSPTYYEKQLVEDYSVFLRKSDGNIHVTDYDTFKELYHTFTYDNFTNSGIVALHEDCIRYVECVPGILSSAHPDWFYEYFTEAFNFPKDNQTIYLYDEDQHCLTATRGSLIVTAGGSASVTDHCVFLRNKFGEIRGMNYEDFIKYYDPTPTKSK